MVHQVNSVRRVFGVLCEKGTSRRPHNERNYMHTSATMLMRAQFEHVYFGVLFTKDTREQFCLIYGNSRS